MARQMTPQEFSSPAMAFTGGPVTSAPTLMSGLHFTFQPSPERQLQDAYALEKASLAALHTERLRWVGVKHFWSMLNKYFVETKQNIRLIETFLDDEAILESLKRAEKEDDLRGIGTLTHQSMEQYEALTASAPDEAVLNFCEQALSQKQEMAEWIDETLPQVEGLAGEGINMPAGNDDVIHRC